MNSFISTANNNANFLTGLPCHRQFFSTVLHRGVISCNNCQRNITSLTHVVVRDHHICVGCFGKVFRRRDCYQILDEKVGKQMLQIAKEVCMLKSIEKNGIENIQLINQEAKIKISHEEARIYIDSLSCRRDKNRKKKKTSCIQQNTKKELEQHMIELPDPRISSKEVKLSYTNRMTKRREKQQQISNQLLASLHERTDQQTLDFMTHFKIRQMSLNHQISRNISSLFNAYLTDPKQRPVQNIVTVESQSRGMQTNSNIAIVGKDSRQREILSCFKLLKSKTIAKISKKQRNYKRQIKNMKRRDDKRKNPKGKIVKNKKRRLSNNKRCSRSFADRKACLLRRSRNSRYLGEMGEKINIQEANLP